MTVENAVRAFAGTIILVSLALGWWVHAGFFLLTAFVGANLLQSAFTGICPAAAVLRRLPFVQSPQGPGAAARGRA